MVKRQLPNRGVSRVPVIFSSFKQESPTWIISWMEKMRLKLNTCETSWDPPRERSLEYHLSFKTKQSNRCSNGVFDDRTFQVYWVLFSYAPTFISGVNQLGTGEVSLVLCKAVTKCKWYWHRHSLLLFILLSSSHNSSPTRGREYKTSLQSAQDKEGYLKINIQCMKLVNIECTLYSRHYSKYYTYQKDSTLTPIYR